MEIIEGKIEHNVAILDIARKTWPDTYGYILSPKQIDYMLDMMYSTEALAKQISELNHHFLMIKKSEAKYFQGFASYEFDYKGSNKTKLHKLYVLPECQGSGMGRILMEKVWDAARNQGNVSVLLNMNRQNKTLDFYKYLGFEIIGEEDIDIGNGFLMEDYIFEKRVSEIGINHLIDSK